MISLKKDDLSWRQRMRERDYTEEDIERVEAEREEDRERAPVPVMPPQSGGVPAGAEPMTPSSEPEVPRGQTQARTAEG